MRAKFDHMYLLKLPFTSVLVRPNPSHNVYVRIVTQINNPYYYFYVYNADSWILLVLNSDYCKHRLNTQMYVM